MISADEPSFHFHVTPGAWFHQSKRVKPGSHRCDSGNTAPARRQASHQQDDSGLATPESGQGGLGRGRPLDRESPGASNVDE